MSRPSDWNDSYPYDGRSQHQQAYPPQSGSRKLEEADEAEEEVLDEKGSLIPWATLKKKETWLRKKLIPYYMGFVVVMVLVALMSIYHKQIIAWLKPIAAKLRELPGGWSIPVGILFVISFPPLFGHEIVAVLCGVVWGLWEGFGIVALGTFLGEIGNFVCFAYLFRGYAARLEQKDVSYSCLAHVVREGGLVVALVVRLSAIPGHFSTVVFSTCGMNIWIFSLAAALSLPKQLITVYLGVVLEDTTADTKSKIISNSVLAVSFLVTIFAAWWIWGKMKAARPAVIAERRRLAKIKQSTNSSNPNDFPAFPESTGSVDSIVDAGRPLNESSNHHGRNPSYQPDYNISYSREHVGSYYHVEQEHAGPQNPFRREQDGIPPTSYAAPPQFYSAPQSYSSRAETQPYQSSHRATPPQPPVYYTSDQPFAAQHSYPDPYSQDALARPYGPDDSHSATPTQASTQFAQSSRDPREEYDGNPRRAAGH